MILKAKSLLPSPACPQAGFTKREDLPYFPKRSLSTGLTVMSLSNSEGRFFEQYVCSIMDFLVTSLQK